MSVLINILFCLVSISFIWITEKNTANRLVCAVLAMEFCAIFGFYLYSQQYYHSIGLDAIKSGITSIFVLVFFIVGAERLAYIGIAIIAYTGFLMYGDLWSRQSEIVLGIFCILQLMTVTPGVLDGFNKKRIRYRNSRVSGNSKYIASN